ncbi:hypothetical protein HAPAU_39810 [Halalkalicoccus paucihalophilus]|uniref:Uncharacterized protein n=1 Tax=Halalkalicoccus paucihalophilus TaxID=1008153 RepID=A0A151A8S7_9EURY|nr:hypothetical protein HAPAU_39810 [Halalkalicoccus paucihalophilus]
MLHKVGSTSRTSTPSMIFVSRFGVTIIEALAVTFAESEGVTNGDTDVRSDVLSKTFPAWEVQH